MKHTGLRNKGSFARALLITSLAILLSLFVTITLAGIFGTAEQFKRATDLLPPLLALISPMIATIVAAYFPRPS